MLRPYPIITLLLLSILLFWCNTTFAQSEEKLTPQFEHVVLDINTLNLSSSFETVPFNEIEFLSSDTRYLELQKFELQNGEMALFKKMKIEQTKMDVKMTNMGEYQHYKNTLVYSPDDKLSFRLGGGLLQQNTLMSGNREIYRFTFHSSVEYELTSWLSAYLYGQYVSNPVNGPGNLYDPVQYMNPLFLQTETGGGLKAKYKNIEAGVGMKAIYDTQFNQSNPVKSMDTKIRIGF